MNHLEFRKGRAQISCITSATKTTEKGTNLPVPQYRDYSLRMLFTSWKVSMPASLTVSSLLGFGLVWAFSSHAVSVSGNHCLTTVPHSAMTKKYKLGCTMQIMSDKVLKGSSYMQ